MNGVLELDERRVGAQVGDPLPDLRDVQNRVCGPEALCPRLAGDRAGGGEDEAAAVMLSRYATLLRGLLKR